MREAVIENKLVREIEGHGGICYKFVSPNNPGVPDRIVITPAGKVIFVELKQEFGRLANLQKWQISRLKERGLDARVIRGMDQVKDFLKEVL